MKRNRNIGSILLIAAGLLLIAAALYELIPALLAYKRADDTYEALRETYVTGQPEADCLISPILAIRAAISSPILLISRKI